MQLAIFEWADASLHGQSTKWEDDLPELGLVTLVSAGIIVKESDTEITLCMDYAPYEKSWRGLATYPKSCFKRIKYIRLPKDWSFEMLKELG